MIFKKCFEKINDEPTFLISPDSVCNSGKWRCSENFCPSRCLIEGQFVTTFDGKQYVVPGKCTYVASQVNFSPTNLTPSLRFTFMILTALLNNLKGF